MKTMEKKEGVRKAVERILDNYLEMNNHRKTPERYAILRAVYSMDGHFTLEELGAELNETYKFPVSRATLYNTLNLFMELRLVIRPFRDGKEVHRVKVAVEVEVSAFVVDVRDAAGHACGEVVAVGRRRQRKSS